MTSRHDARPTLDDLAAALREGESEYLEVKRQFTSDAQIAPTLVAFANADGGILLIGAAETSTGIGVTGLNEAEATRTVDRLRHLAASVVPTPVPVGIAEVDGKPVVYASVDPLPPHLKPVTPAKHDGSNGDPHCTARRLSREATARRACSCLPGAQPLGLRPPMIDDLLPCALGGQRAVRRRVVVYRRETVVSPTPWPERLRQ